METMEQEIIDIIAKQSPADVSNVSLDSTMADLEVDSLGMVEIIFALEEKYDVEIPFNANESESVGANPKTVGEVVVAVRELIAQKNGAA